jgi:hypothetical protein
MEKERGAMNLEGSSATRKHGRFWRVFPLKKVVQSSPQLLKWAKLKQLSLLWVHQSVLTVLQCAAKPVEGWCDMDKNKRSARQTLAP